MQHVTERLSKRLSEDRKLSDTLAKLLQGQPEGKLQVSTTKGYQRFYLVLDGKRRYLGNAERSLAKKLAEKEYYTGLRKKADKEAKLLAHFLKHFDPDGLLDYYERLNKGRKQIVDPVLLPDKIYAEQWLERMRNLQELNSNDYEKPEGFVTLNGETVRSKSEKIIADELKRRGIIYVYEAPLMLNGKVIFPDFTILNLRTREVWYWEHLGKMDDPGYSESSSWKIRRYEAAGFFPGEQLIISMETSQQPLRSEEIDMFIERYLL